MTDIRKVGIVGVGPRGGYAFERLIIELIEQKSLVNIHVSLFEATGDFGNGQVYNLNQNSANWMNLAERVLLLDKRNALKIDTFEIASFPSYHQWIQKNFNKVSEEQKDIYPPRSKIGNYLHQRFQSLISPLIQSNIVSLYEEQVNEVKILDNGKIQINTKENNYKDFDELLLTIGHQSTEQSEQILEWEKFASHKENLNLFQAPYPASNYLNHKNLNEKSIIGILGFGLAMIDIVRAIAEKFGSFIITEEKSQLCIYQSNQAIKNMLVPFSLDGLPPVPKPLNALVDNWFKPSNSSILTFENNIGNKQIQREAENPHFLIAAFASIASGIYVALPNSNNHQNISETEIEKIIVQWLQDQSFEHPLIISQKQSAEKSMQDFVGMATGSKEISLDYCIGQVWRHCQPSIYKKLSFNQCSDSVFAEIIKLDESTKRYSFGPPVESIQQLLALVKAGVLNLDMVDDPEIEMTNDGWRLNNSEQSLTTTMMIDSVLQSPKIKATNSSIVKSLFDQNLIEPVEDNLGVVTDENGYLIPKNKKREVPIALLGRLAKGTIIGVDAILECFGNRPQQWSIKAANNHLNWLNNKQNSQD